jgi:hypothetical protein
MQVRVLVGLSVLVGLAVTAVAAGAATNPPSSYAGLGFIPAAYNSSTGAVRFVKPWGVAGASIPNCTPPATWQIAGVSYDPTLCNTGGSFDAKNNELYTEIPTNAPTPPNQSIPTLLNVAYNSSNGNARVVAGSSAVRTNEFYTQIPSSLPNTIGPSVGLSTSTDAENPPQYNFPAFYPVAYDSLSGNMRFLRPWGVTGASIPNCTPPAPWALSGVTYDPAACNTGGVFDAATTESYTELITG